MASRTMKNLFAKSKSPVSTGTKIGRKVIYLLHTGEVQVGISGPEVSPVKLAMTLDPKARRQWRKALRGMGHNELVLATIPPRQMSRRQLDSIPF